MMNWFKERRKRRRLHEMSSVCELVMAQLGFELTVEVLSVFRSMRSGVRYVVMLDTADHIAAPGLTALRGYFCGALREALGLDLGPEEIVVFALDSNAAMRYVDRVSRRDVLSRQLRGESVSGFNGVSCQ